MRPPEGASVADVGIELRYVSFLNRIAHAIRPEDCVARFRQSGIVTSLFPPKCLQRLVCLYLRFRERRNCAGGDPNSRLNTRLNAASDA